MVMLKIVKAKVKDAKNIHSLVNNFARKDKMLPRSLNEIYENIRDFYICSDNGTTVATSALHILGEDIAEIKSIAVSSSYQGRGIGRRLVERCLKEARLLGVKKVFALTYDPAFLIQSGFREVDKNELPQKVWGDCLKCHKFPDCDEVAVIKIIKK